MQPILRFPAIIFYTLIATIIACVLINTHSIKNTDVETLWRLLALSLLGISISFAFTVLFESLIKKPIEDVPFFVLKKAIFTLTLPLLPLGLFQILTASWPYASYLIGYGQFVFITHLFCAYAPFLRKHSEQIFWHYNRLLLSQFLISGFFSLVFLLGIYGLLLIQTILFDLKISSTYYSYLFIIFGILFNTFFFLTGIPRNWQVFESDVSYPKPIHILASYILMPLTFCYLIVIYGYMINISWLGRVPNGQIGYLVIGIATLGFFTVLLADPLLRSPNNRIPRILTRSFFYSIIGPALLLQLSSFQRIREYGVTENRYFIVMAGLWVICVALIFLIKKNTTIKIIPLSLSLVLILSLLGPWSAREVSYQSQLAKLHTLASKYDMLEEKTGTLKPSRKTPMPLHDRKLLSGILDYLSRYHDHRDWKNLFPSTAIPGEKKATSSKQLMDFLGLKSL